MITINITSRPNLPTSRTRRGREGGHHPRPPRDARREVIFAPSRGRLGKGYLNGPGRDARSAIIFAPLGREPAAPERTKRRRRRRKKRRRYIGGNRATGLRATGLRRVPRLRACLGVSVPLPPHPPPLLLIPSLPCPSHPLSSLTCPLFPRSPSFPQLHLPSSILLLPRAYIVVASMKPMGGGSSM